MSDVKQKPTPTDWTDDRCEDLDNFEKLLNEVSSLNGSHIGARIQACMELAEKLSLSDRRLERKSFCQFLNDLCLKDRFPTTPKGRA